MRIVLSLIFCGALVVAGFVAPVQHPVALESDWPGVTLGLISIIIWIIAARVIEKTGELSWLAQKWFQLIFALASGGVVFMIGLRSDIDSLEKVMFMGAAGLGWLWAFGIFSIVVGSDVLEHKEP